MSPHQNSFLVTCMFESEEMEYIEINEEDPYILNNFKQKVMDAVNLVALISTEHKTAAWKFWEEAGKTVHFFTLGMIQGTLSSEVSMPSEVSFVANKGISTDGKRKLSGSSKRKHGMKEPKPKTARSKPDRNVRNRVRNRVKKKTHIDDKSSHREEEDANELFESLFRESQRAVDSITEPQEELELAHMIESGKSNRSQGEVCAEVIPQIILNTDDIVNQVHAFTTDVNDVTQALRNVSAEVEVDVNIVPSKDTCKKKRKLTNNGINRKAGLKSGKSSSAKSSGRKNMKKKIGLAKKYLRVKRIQTEPTEEFPVLKKKKRKPSKPKPEPSKEEKLRAKYERKLRRRKKKKLDRNFIYESHSYSTLKTNEDNGSADDDNTVDDDYSYSKFLEEEEQKENKRQEVRYNTDGRIRKKRRLKIEEAPDMSCSLCGVKLSSLGALDAHMRIHTGERPFQCQFEGCDKSFTTKGNLKRHEQYHRGERPFECNVCKKTFTEAKTLKVHKRIHTGDRPYKCDLCDAAFTQSNALHAHKSAKHSKQKEHLCELCGEGFILKSMLSNHMREHSEDSEFMCSTCDLSFNDKTELMRHQNTHHCQSKFTCTYCEKKFSSEKRLKDHIKQHNGENLYKCLVCGKTCTDNDSLQIHKATHKAANKNKGKSKSPKKIQINNIKAVQVEENELPTVNDEAVADESIPESNEPEVRIDSISASPDHIIMTGDNLSVNEIQQIQAVIYREAEKFKNSDAGEVQIILSSDHASFFDDHSDNVSQDDVLTVTDDNDMKNEDEVLIVNTSDDQQVLTIYSQSTTPLNIDSL